MAEDERKFFLHELFFRSVERFPNRTAVTFSGNATQSINYDRLGETVKDLSSYFKRIFAKNEVVGIYSNQHLHLPAVLLAVLNASAAFYPASTSLLPQLAIEKFERYSIRYVLIASCFSQPFIQMVKNEDSLMSGTKSRKLVLFDQEEKNFHDSLQKVQFTLFEFMSMDKYVVKWSENLAYMMQTSGTTGEPKAVSVPHSCIVPNILHLSSIFDVTSEDVVFLASPYTFDPFMVQMFLAFANGASLLIVPDNSKLLPQSLCQKLFDQQKVTIFQPTPSFLYYIGPDLISKKILSETSPLSVLAIGGEACPLLSTLRKWKHPKCETKLYNLYGITEVSSWATCYRITEDDLNKRSKNAHSDLCNHCPLGSSLSLTELLVYDDNGSIVEGDGTGHLWIGGDDRKCLLEGETEENIPTMRNSGDLVEIKDGQMWYLGRSDDQLKRFGQRINLECIEKIILDTTDAVSCKLVQQPATIGSTLIHLFVVPPKNMLDSLETFKSLINGRLKKSLPRAAQPDKVHVIFKLPLTNHGKIDKRELLKSMDDVEDEHANTPIVDVLSEMWLECVQNSNHYQVRTFVKDEQGDSGNRTMKRARISCNYQSKITSVKPKHMFILQGGDSLGAVQLADMIERWIGKRWRTISLSMLIDIIINSTFDELVSYVEKQIKEVNTTTKSTLESTYERKENLQHCDDSKSMAKRMKTDNDDDISHVVSTVDKPRSVQNSQTLQTILRKEGRQCSCFARRGFDRVLCLFCKTNPNCLLTSPIITYCSSNIPSFSHFDVSVKWKTSFGKCIDSSPLVLPSCRLKEGAAFIGSHSHLFMSVALSNGDIIWKTRLGGRVESSSCLSLCGQMIVVGCYDGKIYVLAIEDGKIIWTYQTGDQVKSSPCLDEQSGLVWVGSHDRFLYALDLRRKLCKIRVDCVEGSCFSSPTICYHPHQVYIGTLAGRFVAVDAVTGKVKWYKKFDKPIFASPLVRDDHIYLATVDGSLKCFDHCGNNFWVFCAQGPIFSSPVPPSSAGKFGMEEIIFGCHDHHVYCVFSDGTCKWSVLVDGPVYSTPCIVTSSLEFCRANDLPPNDIPGSLRVVIALSTKGTLYELDITDGHILKTFALDGEVFSSPVIVGNKVVVGCRDDYLYCLELS